MKYCSTCGQSYEDQYTFCEEDGSALSSDPQRRVFGYESSEPNEAEGPPAAQQTREAAREDDAGRKAGRLRHRVAAIAMALGLLLLLISAAYITFSGRERRPGGAKTASIVEQNQGDLAYIPTPQAARDYKEEEQPAPEPPAAEQKVEGRTPQGSSTPPTAKDNHDAADRQAPHAPQREPERPRLDPEAYRPVVSQSTGDRIDSNLVRLRSRRTASGMRYEMTFNLKEKAGSAIRWDRLLISTAAASGQKHTETTPFLYQLGAAGTITFTISVEMPGATEADWQGRVVCTSIGRDASGRPMRASFGARVSP